MQKFSLKHCLWLYLFSWPRFTTKWSSIQKCKQPKKPILIMTSQLLMLMLWLKYNNLYILRKDHDFSMKKKILNCVSETFFSGLSLSVIFIFHQLSFFTWLKKEIGVTEFVARHSRHAHTHTKKEREYLKKKPLSSASIYVIVFKTTRHSSTLS